MKVVWAIAGLDPSGGAGLLLDSRVCAAIGVHGVGVATAMTAQGLAGCRGVRALSRAEIEGQIEALGPELTPAAVKIGMLASVEAVRCVAALARPFTVLDPVLAPSTGAPFATDDVLHALSTDLLPHVDLMTPNLPEARRLLGRDAHATVGELATAFLARGVRAVLIKGGHAEGTGPVGDLLATPQRRQWIFGARAPWDARGTGCALSTAIAAYWALTPPSDVSPEEALLDAVVAARAFVAKGLHAAHDLGAPRRVLATQSPMTPAAFPWLSTPQPAAPFPGCGPEPLGFYPVVDRAAWIRRLVPLGVRTIQLRVKDLQGAALLREIAEAQAVCVAHGARLFVNDHWREALELRAYGVHLGQEDLPGADLDALRHAGLRLGLSTHTHAEAARARALSPSYVALGPIFETTLKKMRFAPQGLARLTEWRAFFACPLVAIGGITFEKAAAVRAQGADSIAVVSDVTRHPDPERRTRDWLALWGHGTGMGFDRFA